MPRLPPRQNLDKFRRCATMGCVLPNRIKGAVVTMKDGVYVVSKHTTDPAEFLSLWTELGTPMLVEKEEDSIPYVMFTLEGTGWFLHVNLMARKLSELSAA